MLFYNNKDKIKNSFIVVINILMIIKKRIGGKYAALLGDFALEPSENSEHCFSQNLLCWLHRLQTAVAQSFFVRFQQIYIILKVFLLFKKTKNKDAN